MTAGEAGEEALPNPELVDLMERRQVAYNTVWNLLGPISLHQDAHAFVLGGLRALIPDLASLFGAEVAAHMTAIYEKCVQLRGTNMLLNDSPGDPIMMRKRKDLMRWITVQERDIPDWFAPYLQA